MLIVLGFAMLVCFVGAVMSRRLSALTALILVPAAFALFAGLGPQLGEMVLGGLRTVAPTGVMLLFAMMYFMVMTDAGMFDPLARLVVRAVRGDPLKVMIGTVLLAFLVALDGDGATVYMIVLSALLPVYRRLGLSLQAVATLLLQCTGLGNMLPWGGPTARAAVAMKVDVAEVFVPLIAPILCCVVFTLVLATWFGLKERRRIGVLHEPVAEAADPIGRRDWRLLANWLLTVLLIVGLVAQVLPLPLLFMIGAAVALVLNFPGLSDQAACIGRHAPAILAVASLIFAAAVFTGVLSGSGMSEAMAQGVVRAIPPEFGPYMAVVTALVSIPMTWMVSNDVFYFGMLPVLAGAAAEYGISPAEMARAALVGQPVHILSPLVASTYLLVGMLGLDYGDNQRATLKYSALNALVLLAACLLFGAAPLSGVVVR